jgi:hypothetical protein
MIIDETDGHEFDDGDEPIAASNEAIRKFEDYG